MDNETYIIEECSKLKKQLMHCKIMVWLLISILASVTMYFIQFM